MSARQPRVHRPPGGFAKLAQVERERNEAWAKAERNRLALAQALKLLREIRVENGPLPDGSDRKEYSAEVLSWADRVDALLGGK